MSRASTPSHAIRATRAERRETARGRRPHAARRAQRGFWQSPWPLAIGALAIAAVLGWSVLSSRPSTTAPPATGAAAAQVLAKVTSVPPDVLDKVGAGGVADPLKRTDLALVRGASGKPLVIYVGADYCPFCASERWSLIVALSRFGTFQGVGVTTSSSTDAYPDTPTFSFRGSSYASEVLEFSAVETADRTGKPVATPDAVQRASQARSDPQGSIPYLSIADRYVALGSGYPPDVLRGKTWSDIAAALSDPASPVARAVLGNANRITAAICRTVENAPAAVCQSPSVRDLGAP